MNISYYDLVNNLLNFSINSKDLKILINKLRIYINKFDEKNEIIAKC